VGAVGSPEDAKVATGMAGSGAERLRGRGDFLLVAQGQTLRLQAAFISEQEVRNVVDRIAGRSRPSEPVTPVDAAHTCESTPEDQG